jgi:transketolase
MLELPLKRRLGTNMKWKCSNPSKKDNDVLMMSKGHTAAVQYPYLVWKGFINRADWENWGTGLTILRVSSNIDIPSIDVTSGSLGHSIGIAAGIAFANRADRIVRNNFVVITEGELYEGSTW